MNPKRYWFFVILLFLACLTAVLHYRGYLIDENGFTGTTSIDRVKSDYLDIKLSGDSEYLSRGQCGLEIKDLPNKGDPIYFVHIENRNDLCTNTNAEFLSINVPVIGSILYVFTALGGFIILNLQAKKRA